MAVVEIADGAVVLAFYEGLVVMDEGAAADSGDHYEFGEGGAEDRAVGREGIGKELHDNRLAGLEGYFGGGETGGDL
jgi:hypothetical protein